jgi:primary-amine oxidase
VEGSAERQAFVTLLDRSSGEVFEVIVSLARNAVVSVQSIPGVQPGMTLVEFADAQQAIKSNPDYQAALAKRGITDMSLVSIDCWPNGNFGFAEDGTLRLTRALSFARIEEGGNAYARPIEGVIAVVDLNAARVIRVEDHGVVPLAEGRADYAAARVPNQRDGIKPLEIHQPEGPSFEIEGPSIRWQKWHIRFGFTHSTTWATKTGAGCGGS